MSLPWPEFDARRESALRNEVEVAKVSERYAKAAESARAAESAKAAGSARATESAKGVAYTPRGPATKRVPAHGQVKVASRGRAEPDSWISSVRQPDRTPTPTKKSATPKAAPSVTGMVNKITESNYARVSRRILAAGPAAIDAVLHAYIPGFNDRVTLDLLRDIGASSPETLDARLAEFRATFEDSIDVGSVVRTFGPVRQELSSYDDYCDLVTFKKRRLAENMLLHLTSRDAGTRHVDGLAVRATRFGDEDVAAAFADRGLYENLFGLYVWMLDDCDLRGFDVVGELRAALTAAFDAATCRKLAFEIDDLLSGRGRRDLARVAKPGSTDAKASANVDVNVGVRVKPETGGFVESRRRRRQR